MPTQNLFTAGSTPRPPSGTLFIKYPALIALLLMALFALSPQPARAGQWQVTYTGTLTSADNGQDPLSYDLNDPAVATSDGNGVGFSSQFILDEASGISGAKQVTAAAPTVTITWVPDPGKDIISDPPPNGGKLYLKQTAFAGGLAIFHPSPDPTPADLDFSATAADDGLGDTATESDSNDSDDNGKSVTKDSQGVHLIQRDGSSGTVTLSPSLKATGSVTGDSGPNYAYAADSFLSYGLALDSRAVSINSTIDPTYHKGADTNGNIIRVQDIPAYDGTVNANSVQGVPSITYLLHAQGDWTAGSRYLLHCSSGDPVGGTNSGNSTTGQFTLPADPVCSLTVGYGGTVPSEHAYAHLTDCGDGADATAN